MILEREANHNKQFFLIRKILLVISICYLNLLNGMNYEVPSLKELCAKKYLSTSSKQKSITRLPQELQEYVKGDFEDKSVNLYNPCYKNIFAKLLFEPWFFKYTPIRQSPIGRKIERISFIDVNKQGLLAAGIHSRKKIYVWDLFQKMKMIKIINYQDSLISCLKFSSIEGNNNLYVGCDNGVTIFSDFGTLDTYYTLRKIPIGCENIALSTDEQLSAFSYLSSLKIYHILKNREFNPSGNIEKDEMIRVIQFVPNTNNLLVMTNKSFYLMKVNLEDNVCFCDKMPMQYQTDLRPLKFDPTYRWLICNDFKNKKIKIVSIKGKEIIDLLEYEDNCPTIKFNGTGSLLASIDCDGNIIIWDMTKNHKRIAKIKREDYCSESYSVCDIGDTNYIAFVPIDPVDRYLVVAFDEYIFKLDLWKYYSCEKNS